MAMIWHEVNLGSISCVCRLVFEINRDSARPLIDSLDPHREAFTLGSISCRSESSKY